MSWTEQDYNNLRDHLLLGIYQVGQATVGRPVLIREVCKHIEMKGYWGRPDLLENYFRFRDNDDTYKNTIDALVQRLVQDGFVESHIGLEQISITRRGRDHVSMKFTDADSI